MGKDAQFSEREETGVHLIVVGLIYSAGLNNTGLSETFIDLRSQCLSSNVKTRAVFLPGVRLEIGHQFLETVIFRPVQTF